VSRGRPESRGEVVYGRNPVRELIAAGARTVHEIRVLAPLLREPWPPGIPVAEASRAELGRLAGTADHQGVVAVADPFPYADATALLERPGPVVCLDGAQDPRNLGAIARVAEGAGAAGLVIPRRGGPGVTPTVVKASAGAVEHLPVARVDNLAAFLHDARGTGRVAVGAEASSGDDYRSFAWPTDVLLVLGAEGTGLRPRVRAACEALVRIPMRGRIGSLNVSVAAALLLFEAIRNGN
jgi:23S rRNA (guanosine2251-2'-O)-methyltransferase